jgi:isoleucyl-tRNA synthetase
VSHGIVLGSDGQKMSKSLRNYPDPYEMFDRYGADAMRWFLLSSTILRGGDFAVTEEGIRDVVRHYLLPLWNAWSFLSLYANAAGLEGHERTDSPHVLDRYLLAKTHDLVESVTATMDVYDLFGAYAAVRQHLDGLTNWYIRRSRNRFWAGDQDAIDTLHTVLAVTLRVLAPLAPMVAEDIYRDLTGERSVHLTDWPDPAELPADPELVAVMDRAREVCSSALAVRKANGLRVRQPLATLTVATPDADSLAPFAALVADEVNVKELRLVEDVASVAHAVLQVVPAVAGPRLGPDVQAVIRAVRTGDWRREGDTVVAGGIALQEGEYTLRLVAADEAASGSLPRGDGVVVLDLTVTPELAAEGLARDLVRLVQQARRDAGLDVSDRIALTVGVPEDVRGRLGPHEAFIAGETLATTVAWGQPADGTPLTLGGAPVSVEVERAAS